MFPHRKYLLSYFFSPMKQIVLASILAIALVPALSFAENNDMQEPPTNGSGAVQNNHEQHNDMQGVPPMGSGAMMGSGMMGSGEIMKHEMDGLRGAMEKLTPEQYTELAKMIRTYLESKGIQVPTPEVKKTEGERKGWD